MNKKIIIKGALCIIISIAAILLSVKAVATQEISLECLSTIPTEHFTAAPTQESKEETTESVLTEEINGTQKESTQAFIVSGQEREIIARLVYLEARGESYECQKAVASVVINRWISGQWGNSISSVVYAKNQFTPARRIPYTTPTQMNYDAVDDVLQNGTTLPYYVMYFRANYHHRWRGYVGYKVIDNTYFGYMKRDKNI